MQSLHNERFWLNTQLRSLPVKTGDIFFRLGHETYCGLPFSQLVAAATQSKYSHASVALVDRDEIWLAEVNLTGTSQIRFVDWADFCYGDFEVWRPTYDFDHVPALDLAFREFVNLDEDYDLKFDYKSTRRVYCTKSVEVIWELADLPPLCKPMLAKDVMAWWAYQLLRLGDPIARLAGASIPLWEPLWFVGNEKMGLMSSPNLTRVYSSDNPPMIFKSEIERPE